MTKRHEVSEVFHVVCCVCNVSGWVPKGPQKTTRGFDAALRNAKYTLKKISRDRRSSVTLDGLEKSGMTDVLVLHKKFEVPAAVEEMRPVEGVLLFGRGACV